MTTKRTTQITRIDGKRVRLVTTTSAAGTRVQVQEAAPKEWELQAAQVQRLRAMPEYGKAFLLAADMNAERRGQKARMMALATGMTAGEADLRFYLAGGRLHMIENKAGKGPLSPAQVARHAVLEKLGHHVTVVRAVTKEEAADKAVSLVRGWIADNDNLPDSSGCRKKA